MSDYIFLVNPGIDIVNHVQLTKFVPNRREKTQRIIDYKIGVYLQYKHSKKWKKLDEIVFNESNNISLSNTDYNLDVGEVAVIIPVATHEKLSDNLDQLPKPISRKLDGSWISDRAAILFKKGNAFSSYQGEFPYAMSKIKGTFLAFDPLIRGNIDNIQTRVVFVNINSKIVPSKEVFELSVSCMDSKEKIMTKKYVHNSACILDLERDERCNYVFYSKDTLGVPIFISYDDAESYLSVEHTHPPSEFFWKNKFKGQKMLKEHWLSVLP
jgi:hypothetical protein